MHCAGGAGQFSCFKTTPVRSQTRWETRECASAGLQQLRAHTLDFAFADCIRRLPVSTSTPRASPPAPGSPPACGPPTNIARCPRRCVGSSPWPSHSDGCTHVAMRHERRHVDRSPVVARARAAGASCPPAPIQELRDCTCTRGHSCMKSHAMSCIQKSLEDANRSSR